MKASGLLYCTLSASNGKALVAGATSNFKACQNFKKMAKPLSYALLEGLSLLVPVRTLDTQP